MQDQHVRGPFSNLVWLAATIFAAGLVLVWGWNSVAVPLFHMPAVAYWQAIAGELVLVALVIVGRVALGGGHRRSHHWGSGAGHSRGE
jgi:hypothetical protein